MGEMWRQSSVAPYNPATRSIVGGSIFFDADVFGRKKPAHGCGQPVLGRSSGPGLWFLGECVRGVGWPGCGIDPAALRREPVEDYQKEQIVFLRPFGEVEDPVIWKLPRRNHAHIIPVGQSDALKFPPDGTLGRRSIVGLT